MTACRLCGSRCTGVGELDPSRYPYCMACHYTGAGMADIHAGLIEALRGAGHEAGVWQTGGGCMNVAVTRPGEAWPMISLVEAVPAGPGAVEPHLYLGEPRLPLEAPGSWHAILWPTEPHWDGDHNADELVEAAPLDVAGCVAFVQQRLPV